MDGRKEEPPVTFSLKFQSRALAAVASSKLISTWVVGTNALREAENEVRYMQYDPDQERLVSVKALTHAPEIWDVSASPSASDLLLTVWSQGGNYGATLWSTAGTDAVHKLSDLPGHTTTIRRALWHHSQPDLAVTLEESALHTWNVAGGQASKAATGHAGELLQLWSVALQPQTSAVCATAGGNNVQLWDMRSMSISGELMGAHRMPVRDVCFSPASEHRLVSAGDDCKVRVWDTRQLGKSEPLHELGGHTHWVWRAQFSPFHEQLQASASSDCLVNLHYAPALGPGGSASSAASGAGGDDKTGAGQASGPQAWIRSYDEHEDSVYGLAWSAADPWLFASLSYDGRVVVNKVPKDIKYRIMV